MHLCRCVLNARRFVCVSLVVAFACSCADTPVAAYTPKSKLVRSLRKQAIKRLEKADPEELGGKCLIAMAFYNEFGKKSHPKVQSAVAACQKELSGITPEGDDMDNIYSTAIACIFLCKLDAAKYQTEIDFFMRSLEIRQRPYGAWGYPKGGRHPKTGDTSMTQYAVLCLWTAKENGVPISMDSTTKVCNWLLRTQDPSGAWGYQGNDPGVGRQPRSLQQTRIRHSMVAAGVGSLYVLADLLQLVQPRRQSINNTTPSVLRKAPTKIAVPLSNQVDKGAFRSAIDLGDAWFEKNLIYEGTRYTCYYMYAMERYQAFRERFTGRPEEEPHWYNVGVDFLRKEQQPSGGWRIGITEVFDTTFALLFLQRSTRMVLNPSRFGGTLRADRGLPDGPWKLGKDGRIEQQKIVGPAEEILKRLENDADLEWTSEQSPDVELSDDPEERAAQIARLERLVRAAKFQPRFVAVKTLSRIRDLDRVPALIYALSDRDPLIRQQSRAGLRFISRKFGGFGLPDDPSEPDKQAAISKWKHWYSSVRPDAEFWE